MLYQCYIVTSVSLGIGFDRLPNSRKCCRFEPGQDSELFVYFVYKVLDDGYSCRPSAAVAFLFFT